MDAPGNDGPMDTLVWAWVHPVVDSQLCSILVSTRFAGVAQGVGLEFVRFKTACHHRDIGLFPGSSEAVRADFN
jgi:hypothetical protein